MRSHVGQNGARVIIITDSPLYFPEDAPSPAAMAKKSVGLIELVVDNTGKGRGNMVEALQITLDADGVFQVVTPGTTKIDLENVQQKR
jgi:prolyl-tRNA editing enzyme YbaK/EbsC (Cys-tRNA(Pro) deacylase)